MRLEGKHVLVTGGAGFIGSNLVARLVELGNKVAVYDNLSTGQLEFLHAVKDRITFIKADLLDKAALDQAMKGVDFVFHLAAHADVKENLKHPEKLLEQNTIVTSNVLESMRRNGVSHIAFASTGSIYGDPEIHPTPENAPFPTQTSMYSASKLAGEGLLQAYSVGFGFNVYIFRFVSFMGEHYTHGCVFDFINKLKKDPASLHILGNGRQRKSYLYVKDGVNAMITVIQASEEPLNIYNLGHDDYIEVTPIAQIVCEELGLKDVRFDYAGGERGWVGDGPFIHLDISRLKKLGWKPTLSIPDCVRRTARWLISNPVFLERR
jgi:UDP-glucose 4-epimerase